MTHWKEGRGNLFTLGWPVSHAHHSGFLHWVLQPQCWGWLKMLATLALFSQRLPWYYGGGYFNYRFQRNCDVGNWMLAELLPCTIYVKTPYAFWLQGSNMFSCSAREIYHVWTCLWLLFGICLHPVFVWRSILQCFGTPLRICTIAMTRNSVNSNGLRQISWGMCPRGVVQLTP